MTMLQKVFNILVIGLNVLHNCFQILSLYLAKFLDISAKSFFLCHSSSMLTPTFFSYALYDIRLIGISCTCNKVIIINI